MDRQCSSCGGFCRKSGCERENVKPEQEPVAWAVPNTRPTEKARFMMFLHSPDVQYPEQLVPLYTAPPQREWQGLTLDEIFDSTHGFTRIQKDDWVATDTDIAEFAHIIEARLKAKNT